MNKNYCKYLGWCPDLASRLNLECECCTTCHEDEDGDYILLGQVEFEDGYYDACCKMKNRVENAR